MLDYFLSVNSVPNFIVRKTTMLCSHLSTISASNSTENNLYFPEVFKLLIGNNWAPLSSVFWNKTSRRSWSEDEELDERVFLPSLSGNWGNRRKKMTSGWKNIPQRIEFGNRSSSSKTCVLWIIHTHEISEKKMNARRLKLNLMKTDRLPSTICVQIHGLLKNHIYLFYAHLWNQKTTYWRKFVPHYVGPSDEI